MRESMPDIRINQSDEQRFRCSVPTAIRALAPGYAGRSRSRPLSIMQESMRTFAAAARATALGVFVTMIALLAGVPPGYANDAFATVRCDANVLATLAGKRIPTEAVVKLERKHEGIGLKAKAARRFLRTCH